MDTTAQAEFSLAFCPITCWQLGPKFQKRERRCGARGGGGFQTQGFVHQKVAQKIDSGINLPPPPPLPSDVSVRPTGSPVPTACLWLFMHFLPENQGWWVVGKVRLQTAGTQRRVVGTKGIGIPRGGGGGAGRRRSRDFQSPARGSCAVCRSPGRGVGPPTGARGRTPRQSFLHSKASMEVFGGQGTGNRGMSWLG